MFVDPVGLDIAVIDNGRAPGNPIGHTAIAVTGAGVYSYGNNTRDGSSLRDYLRRESPRRNTVVTVIQTTPEQDAKVLEYLRRFPNTTLPGDLASNLYDDNCSVRSNNALDAAGVPYPIIVDPGRGQVTTIPGSFPGSAGWRARYAGGTSYPIPRGTATVPAPLSQFEPR
jgi:hypothetical protein